MLYWVQILALYFCSGTSINYTEIGLQKTTTFIDKANNIHHEISATVGIQHLYNVYQTLVLFPINVGSTLSKSQMPT